MLRLRNEGLAGSNDENNVRRKVKGLKSADGTWEDQVPGVIALRQASLINEIGVGRLRISQRSALNTEMP